MRIEPITYPTSFRGVFAKVLDRHLPLLEQSREELVAATVHEGLQPYYDWLIRESRQPSFLLVPLQFLATADAVGGVSPLHEQYLPALMLLMEVTAISDDTIDRSLQRSGRATFAAHFGEAAATPLSSALSAMAVARAYECNPSIAEHTVQFLMNVAGFELWERTNIYPDPSLFMAWLDHRYEQTRLSPTVSIDAALLLHGKPGLPTVVSKSLARIIQDVDDIVNILENREVDGENNDLKMGVVTRPMLEAFDRRPALLDDLERLWKWYRPLKNLSIRDFDIARRMVDAESSRDLEIITEAVVTLGIPNTLKLLVKDIDNCVNATPKALRTLVFGIAATFVERLRRCMHSNVLEQVFRQLDTRHEDVWQTP